MAVAQSRQGLCLAPGKCQAPGSTGSSALLHFFTGHFPCEWRASDLYATPRGNQCCGNEYMHPDGPHNSLQQVTARFLKQKLITWCFIMQHQPPGRQGQEEQKAPAQPIAGQLWPHQNFSPGALVKIGVHGQADTPASLQGCQQGRRAEPAQRW